MKVFCCQHDIAWEDRDANLDHVRSLLRGASLPKGSLVLLPEMFAVGFSMDVVAVAESDDGPTGRFLTEMARELGVFLMGGVVHRAPDGRGLNDAVVVNPSGIEVARYTKSQPFTPAGEAAAYAAGAGPVVFDWDGCRVAPFICYDLRFPELQRPAARSGARLMTFIASWPAVRIQHWIRLLQARAIENQCWVAAANRVGSDPNSRYCGRSVLINHHGDIVADAGETEGIIGAEIDLPALEAYRRERPFLADMQAGLVPDTCRTTKPPG